MNDLKNYVIYAQPVIKAIRENHNDFHLLQYFTVSAEDLTIEEGLLNFMTQDKNRPEHFSGNIPLVYAQWGEETGASIVLQITPEQRKLLTPEVLSVFHQEGWNTDWKKWWNKTADQTVYVLMEHEYYSTCAGFVPSTEFEDVNNVGEAMDFLSHRLGIPYLSIQDPNSGLEYYLDWASSYTNA